MDHTPTTAASDDRALRFLERTPVAPPHKERLTHLVQEAQAAATHAGAELQAEFGREHVGLIVGCNQFLRVMRAGAQPGAVELFLEPADRVELSRAGFELQAPDGAVFRMFGWVRVDPMQGDAAALDEAVRKAFIKAKGAKAPSKK